MGQTLSEPVTAKQSSVCQDDRYHVGASCMQGWRVSMEDSHTHILSLPDDPGTAFFAVYDGHGGARIAQYAGTHLHKYIVQRPEYHVGNIEEALKQGFLELDAAMAVDEVLRDEVAGSTAVAVLIRGSTLYCANVGDSRAIASINGRVEELSHDHKPTDHQELARIKASGGWVEFNRVNGNLALSRALGDYVFKRNHRLSPEDQTVTVHVLCGKHDMAIARYMPDGCIQTDFTITIAWTGHLNILVQSCKDQEVTAYPEVQVRELNDDWEFIVIACDGIWDVMTNTEVILFCRTALASGLDPATVCEQLMQRCLAPSCAAGGLGCDNMTVQLVCLTAPTPDKPRTFNTLVTTMANNPTDKELVQKLLQQMEEMSQQEEELDLK